MYLPEVEAKEQVYHAAVLFPANTHAVDSRLLSPLHALSSHTLIMPTLHGAPSSPEVAS
jgi:hypothetical protein